MLAPNKFEVRDLYQLVGLCAYQQRQVQRVATGWKDIGAKQITSLRMSPW